MAPNGGGRSAVIPAKEPSTQCTEGCVGSKAGPDVLGKTNISHTGRESKDRNESPEERAVTMGKCKRVAEDVWLTTVM